MINITNNLDNFINDQKEFYSTLNTCESWDSDIWYPANTWLPYKDKKMSLNHCQISRIKGFKPQKISNEYVNFIKAMTIYLFRKRRSSLPALNAYHINLKRIYGSLVLNTQQASPIYIGSDVINYIDNQLIKHNYKNLHDAAANLLVIVDQINNLHLSLFPIHFANQHRCPNLAHTKNLVKKRKQLGELDNLTRKDEEKLISFSALKAFAYITNHTKNDWELLGCRIIDLLLITGFRINELLYLKKDCWVEIPIKNIKTGENIVDCNNKIIMQYGIKYFSEKNADTHIHWLDELAVPIAKRAYKDIYRITKPYRDKAKWIASQNGKNILDWPDSTIKTTDMIDTIMSITSSSRDFPSTHRDRLHKWLTKLGVKETDCLTSSYNRNKFMDRVYLTKDIDDALRSFYSFPNKPTKIIFSAKNGTIIEDCLSEFLIVVPVQALKLKKASKVHAAPQLLKTEEINSFIGAITAHQSIFDEYGFMENDGSKIKWTSHIPRHNINTFLRLAGLSEHLQTIAMGRNNITQNRTYQHLTLQEELQSQKRFHINKLSNKTNSYSEERLFQQIFHSFDSSDDHVSFLHDALSADTLMGELQETFNKIKENDNLKSAQEFIQIHGRNFHIVINGACTRDLTLHPCPNQLKCISDKGCIHLHLTGRDDEQENIEYQYKNSLLALNSMQQYLGKNADENSFLKKQKATVETLRDLLVKSIDCKKKLTKILPYPSGKYLDKYIRKDTIVERFAIAQQGLINEK